MGKSARNANRAYKDAKGRLGHAVDTETLILSAYDRLRTIWKKLSAGLVPVDEHNQWMNTDAGRYAMAGMTVALDKWVTGGRVIFDVDPDLLAALQASPPSGIPASILDHLPYDTFVVRAHYGVPGDDLRYNGFIYTRSDVGEDAAHVVGLGELNGQGTPFDYTRLDDMIVDGQLQLMTEDGLRRSYELIDEELTEINLQRHHMSQATILGVLAYLSSDQPDVENVTPPEFAHKVHSTGRTLPTVYRTGWAVGAALRAAERQERESAESEGRAVRPHLRRAHWHLYWTGPRTDPKPLLKWLAPIAVGTGDVRTVRPVA